MKNLRILLATFVVAGAIAAPVAAEAQWRGGRNQDRWDNNRDGNRGRMQVGQIRTLVIQAERESNELRGDFERTYDRRDLGRYGRGDDALRLVQRLDQSLERLRREADNRNPRQGRDEMRVVLQNAQAVERLFDRNRGFHSTVTGDWNRLRSTLNRLSRAYDLGTTIR